MNATIKATYTVAICCAVGGAILFVREATRAVFPLELTAAAVTGMAAAVIPLSIAYAVERVLSPLSSGKSAGELKGETQA